MYFVNKKFKKTLCYYNKLFLKINRKILCFFISIFLISAANSQENKKPLTLSACLELAQKNSPAVQIAKQDYYSRIQNYKAFKAGFYPQLDFTGSLPGMERGINSITQPGGQIRFVSQSNLFSYGNLEISQKIPWTGAELTVGSGINRIDIIGESAGTLWRTNPLLVSLTQPLFSFNSMKWDLEIQDRRSDFNYKQFIETMEEINIDISSKFFDLYIAQMNVKNAELNLAINDTLYMLSGGRYKVGTIAENDLLQSELELANARIALDEANMNYLQSLDQLRIALGFSENLDIEIIPPEGQPQFQIDLQKALDYAVNNNSRILDLSINEISADRDLERAESNNRFNANLSASYGLNKSASQFNGVYSELLDQERLNLTFSFPLYHWGKGNSEIQAALANQDKSAYEKEIKRNEFILNVKYQVLRFAQLQKQLLIAARSDTIAAKRFEVSKNRYMIGKIDMNDLFIAQREKDNAVRSYFQTLKEFWVAYYRIRQLTLFDFLENKALEYNYQ